MDQRLDALKIQCAKRAATAPSPLDEADFGDGASGGGGGRTRTVRRTSVSKGYCLGEVEPALALHPVDNMKARMLSGRWSGPAAIVPALRQAGEHLPEPAADTDERDAVSPGDALLERPPG